jgi:membrane protein YdbS with pleckstrin-like domain
VFGPLPRLHRLLVITTVLVVAVGSGVWLTQFTPIPFAAVAGAAWGALAGMLLSFVLLHEFHHRPRTVRVRRH